jgi:hypothetical protein
MVAVERAPFRDCESSAPPLLPSRGLRVIASPTRVPQIRVSAPPRTEDPASRTTRLDSAAHRPRQPDDSFRTDNPPPASRRTRPKPTAHRRQSPTGDQPPIPARPPADPRLGPAARNGTSRESRTGHRGSLDGGLRVGRRAVGEGWRGLGLRGKLVTWVTVWGERGLTLGHFRWLDVWGRPPVRPTWFAEVALSASPWLRSPGPLSRSDHELDRFGNCRPAGIPRPVSADGSPPTSRTS